MNKKYSFFLFLLFVLNCSLFTIRPEIEVPYSNQYSKKLETIDAIFIEDIVGNLSDFFYPFIVQAFEEQNIYQILKIYPNNRSNFATLKIKVLEVNRWEEFEDDLDDPENLVLRRNIILKMRFSLRKVEEETLLFDKVIEQPYQQIYLSKEAIAKRVPMKQEIQRVTQYLFAKFVSQLNYNHDNEIFPLEMGENNSLFEILVPGNSIIMKGIRLAEGGNYGHAKDAWKVVLFEPLKENQSEESFLQNRASAYYNIAQVLKLEKKWNESAQFFALANYSVPTIKYSQAWSDIVQRWKEQQNKDISQEELLTLKTRALKKSNKKFEFKSWKLLNYKKLWPVLDMIEKKEQENNQDNPINSKKEVPLKNKAIKSKHKITNV